MEIFVPFLHGADKRWKKHASFLMGNDHQAAAALPPADA